MCFTCYCIAPVSYCCYLHNCYCCPQVGTIVQVAIAPVDLGKLDAKNLTCVVVEVCT
jgi:hypothetical protein